MKLQSAGKLMSNLDFGTQWGLPTMSDVIVIGAGPAGVVAALRAADLGATTALVMPRRVWRHGGQ